MSNSKERIFAQIENFDCGKIIEFLEANGLEEFHQIIQIKDVDGAHFLSITEYEVLSWKPHITLQQARKLWAFVKKFKEDPKKCVIPKCNILPRPNITKEQLENLCNDQEIISQLQDLLQQRQRTTVHQEDSDNQSFSSDDEAYANADAISNPFLNLGTSSNPSSNLVDNKLQFQKISQELKPTIKQQSVTATESDDAEDIYENASKPLQVKRTTKREMRPHDLPARHFHTPLKSEDPEETYENAFQGKPNIRKAINFPTIPIWPSHKPITLNDANIVSKLQDGKAEFKQGTRTPLLPGRPSHTSVKLKALPQIPAYAVIEESVKPKEEYQEETDGYLTMNMPKESSKKTEPAARRNKNDIKSHLESIFSQELPTEYSEPNQHEDEQVYEPEPNFQVRKGQQKGVMIQKLPLPSLPGKHMDLRSPSPTLRQIDNEASTSLLRSRALPKPPSCNKEPEMRTLPRPPQPNFRNKSLESLPYYRNASRKEAEMLLTEDLGDGSYLFRTSNQYYCTLSVRCQKKIYHIGIKQNEDGKLECLSSGRHFYFDNVHEICEHFKSNPLRMIDNYNNYISVTLRDVLL